MPVAEFKSNRLTLPAHHGVQNKNLIVGIAGRKGTGKSEVTRDIGEKCSRWYHFDTMGEHRWIANCQDTTDDATFWLLDVGQTSNVFHGRYLAGEDLENDLIQISDAVWDCANLTFCVEEIPMMSGPGHAPKRFMRIVRTGRHVNVNVVWTCQRLSEAPVTLRSATDIFILFHHSEPLDLSAISQRCGNDVAVAVSKLGEHDFLVWDVTARKPLAYQEFVGVVLPRFQS